MNLYLPAILLCCGIITSAQKQQTSPADNGIYKSATDFLNGNLIMAFTNPKNSGTSFKYPLGHYNELQIKTKDSTYTFYDDDIWGYREHGIDYRIYNDDLYRIDYAGKIIIYTIPPPPGNGNGSTPFFSRTISTPVHELNRNSLIGAFHNDTAFVQKIKQLRWGKSIFSWNKNEGHYNFIDWIN